MTLASFFSSADRFESYLVENPKDRCSHDKAHLQYHVRNNNSVLKKTNKQSYGASIYLNAETATSVITITRQSYD